MAYMYSCSDVVPTIEFNVISVPENIKYPKIINNTPEIRVLE